jgi:hypothetical protein
MSVNTTVPPGINPVAVNKHISYHITYQIIENELLGTYNAYRGRSGVYRLLM